MTCLSACPIVGKERGRCFLFSLFVSTLEQSTCPHTQQVLYEDVSGMQKMTLSPKDISACSMHPQLLCLVTLQDQQVRWLDGTALVLRLFKETKEVQGLIRSHTLNEGTKIGPSTQVS